MEISSARHRGTSRPSTTPRGIIRGNGRVINNTTRTPTHNCKNCGQPWDNNHQAKCQAIGQTCRRCNKQNHYAKVCRSNLNRPQHGRSVNEIENQGLDQTTQGINMIILNTDNHSTYEDSADELLSQHGGNPGRPNDTIEITYAVRPQQILGND